MRNYIIIFLSLLIIPFVTVLADDAGFEIPPKVYAAQELAVSATNYGQTLCNSPEYTCRAVKKGDHWYNLFPNYRQREEVMRLNRTNVSLMYRSWIIVPKDFSKTTYMDMSPLPNKMDTHGKKLLFVNLHLFAFGAYDAQGNLVYWGPVSSGADKCPANSTSCKTTTGAFKVFRIEGKDCASNEFPLETHGGAPMPYCLFFHGGSAVHGSTLSGFINRSAGCVRLFYADAQWLYERFASKGMEVIVKP
ncbi:MAG: L,D-transpeptidase [Gammaproteobacteria bacterium]|nr:L,D-transpeptidase [Gammaproteobacteria bacterium]